MLFDVYIVSAPGKAFQPTDEGEVLGILYNIPRWEMSLDTKKLDPILSLLFTILEADWADNDDVASLNGKICHYHLLAGNLGRYERAFLLHLQDCSQFPAEKVKVTPQARSQCQWWIVMLWDAKNAVPIPDIRKQFPAASLALYTDAAGLPSIMEMKHSLNGWGSVMVHGGQAVMCLYKWPAGMFTPEETYSHKMSFLEGLAGLAGLYSVADIVAGRAVTLYVDNRGLVFGYYKGHSSCDYTSSVILALKRFSVSIGTQLALEWVPRCSCKMTVAADFLSKGQLNLASREVGLPVKPGRYSLTLQAYVDSPTITRVLGQALAVEAGQFMRTVPTGLESKTEVETLVRLKQTKY